MKTKVATQRDTRRPFMRRQAIFGVLLAVLVVGGTSPILAEHRPRMGFGGPPSGMMEMGPEGFEERMAKILKLTDTQQSRIKTILDAEREQIKPLFDKMRESRKLLMQAAEATVYDEVAVRAVIAGMTQIETELIVSRTSAQSRINALLTPEQRELLKNIMPDVDGFPPPPF